MAMSSRRWLREGKEGNPYPRQRLPVQEWEREWMQEYCSVCERSGHNRPLDQRAWNRSGNQGLRDKPQEKARL